MLCRQEEIIERAAFLFRIFFPKQTFCLFDIGSLGLRSFKFSQRSVHISEIPLVGLLKGDEILHLCVPAYSLL
jgi:hypothetical protein